MSAVVIMFPPRRSPDVSAGRMAKKTSRPPAPRGHREVTPSSLGTFDALPPPEAPGYATRTAEGGAGAVLRLRSLAVDALAALMLARELFRRSAALLERARAGR